MNTLSFRYNVRVLRIRLVFFFVFCCCCFFLALHTKLHELSLSCWERGILPQDLRSTVINPHPRKKRETSPTAPTMMVTIVPIYANSCCIIMITTALIIIIIIIIITNCIYCAKTHLCMYRQTRISTAGECMPWPHVAKLCFSLISRAHILSQSNP